MKYLDQILEILDKYAPQGSTNCKESIGSTPRETVAQAIADIDRRISIEESFPEDEVWVIVWCQKPNGVKFAAIDKYTPCGFIFNKGIVTHWESIRD